MDRARKAIDGDLESEGSMNTEEDEFRRIEREALRRAAEADDDDTQVYAKPWIGLTDEDKQTAVWTNGTFGGGALWAEAMLKERNT